MAWNWAAVTAGAGTDSITCSFNWGADSLVWGENFVCCVPFEDMAAITNNLGLGSAFAGNLEVYPVYRINYAGAVEEDGRSNVRTTRLPTIARGVLFMAEGSNPSILLDSDGRQVAVLQSGANDVRRLAPGVYFVRSASGSVREASGDYKVILTK